MVGERVESAGESRGGAAATVVQPDEPDGALQALADMLFYGVGADAVAIRRADPAGRLVVAALAPHGSVAAAELAGSAVDGEALRPDALPEPTRRAAGRVGAVGTAFERAVVAGRVVGSVEALRADRDFSAAERLRVADAAERLASLLDRDRPPSSTHRSMPENDELARARAVLRVTLDANATLSLRDRVETTARRVSQTLGIDRVGLYLASGDRVELAASTGGLPSGHALVARALLRASVGPARARTILAVAVGDEDKVLDDVRATLEATGSAAVLAVPLRLRRENVGLVVLYPDTPSNDAPDEELLTALASQIATSVQNARLHERTELLAAERSSALAEAQRTERRLTALYEISSAFSETLSLDRTIAAVVATVVDALAVDAAVIRVPDERGELLIPRAVHVADERHREAAQSLLGRPQPFRVRRGYRPEALDEESAADLGAAHALLIPFLRRGSTAAVIPIAAKGEVLAELTVVSLDPTRPIGEEALVSARSLALQAALALENARLHVQLRDFAESMRRSLLPDAHPEIPGLEIGHRYESAAALEVGGDVFDFLELPDGRLAVVLGDVTGHGVDAAAEMALSKFVFRSLARSHETPAALLTAANDILEAEIPAGGFVTMVCVFADAAGRIRYANAGHPRPRLVSPGRAVSELSSGGLALAIAPDQLYDETEVSVERGAALVLYTDGVIEARRGGELYGTQRLDDVLAMAATHSAQEIADAVLADCRAFAGGELVDDCAVVVIRRS